MKKTYTPEELKTVLEEHKKWLESEDGEEGSRANLSSANLSSANLCDANLRNADLRNADLCDANLRNADLRDANLSSANLCGSYLRDADLRDANLSSANLCYANLRNADLCDANLRNADLRDAILCEANLCGSDLRDANLCRANLDMSAWPLWCGGTRTYLDRRRSLQMIYHLFNQHHQDPEIHAALEALRPLANEFRENHRRDAPALRGVEMVLAPNKENK